MAFRYPAAGSYTFDAYNDSDVAAFLWTDPIVTNQTVLPDGTPSAQLERQWNWTDGDTGSSNVGPTSGAGGSPDGYAYTEASSPAAADDEFTLELDQTLDASTNNIEIQFKTNQRGDDNDATCVVETNENGAGWVERGATFGGSGDTDKVATSGTQIWSQRSVDLTGLISHASTRVRIKVTINGATIWNCDYGIDEVVVIGTSAITLEQEGFRFYADGTESGSTALETQDTDIDIAKETTFQQRVLIDSTGDAPSQQYQLEYKENGDAATEWRKVPLT